MRATVPVSLAVLTIALAGCLSAPSPGPESLGANALLGAAGGTLGVVHGVDGLPAADGLVAQLRGTVGAARYTGADHDEPTLGVDAQGNLFVSGIVSEPPFGFTPTVMRSMDQGATWEDVGKRLPTGGHDPPTTLDPYVYVDPTTGRVFDLDLYAACAYLSWSDDQGATWTTNPIACGTPVVPNDHQTFVAAKPRQASTSGYPNALYYCVNRVADTACARSFDGGITFGPLLPAYLGVDPSRLGLGSDPLNQGPDGFCGGLSGHIKAAPDGTLFLPRDYCGVPSVAVSKDDGTTWTIAALSTEQASQEHEIAIAVDDAGNVYAFWGNATGLPMLAVSRDAGATWGPARMVGVPGLTAMAWPAIAAGVEGKVAFAYIGSTVPGGYEGKNAVTCSGAVLPQCEPTHDWDNATWNAYIGVVTDALSDAPTVVTVTANDPADPVARGLCGRTRCHGIYDFIDIVIDAGGRPWAAFDDVCTDKCSSDPNGTTGPNEGFVGTLASGPTLRGPAGALVPLPAVPAAEPGGQARGGSARPSTGSQAAQRTATF